MTVFESKVRINKPVQAVYNFLSDFNNHQQLMPDSISNWSSDVNNASFTVQNMAKLVLKISNRIENSSVIIIPAAAAPFNVDIRWVTVDLGDGTTEAVLTLSAELNMMLKMMASGPLQKLVEYETAALARMV